MRFPAPMAWTRVRERTEVGIPAWLAGLLAAAMIAVAVYCASRLVAARRSRHPAELDADGLHVVMGVTMAGMLTAGAGGLRFLPAAAPEAVFALGAAWFGWQLARIRRGRPLSARHCPQPLPHLVECAAMLYMFLVPPASGRSPSARAAAGMAGPAGHSPVSVLALVLAVFTFGYVVWLCDQLTAGARAQAACRIAMGITMGYLLVLML